NSKASVCPGSPSGPRLWNSAAKGSYGSRLMNNRKREKAGLQRELARLEAQVVIPLFPTEAVA
ncbi:hypothetical protein, partial [Streptomyces sp. NPDC052535]|uniref:hypothetical protein n=1 Tax=Streptomyces sp. NPDC052535 TaxID=3155531 RepID=UPI0034344628